MKVKLQSSAKAERVWQALAAASPAVKAWGERKQAWRVPTADFKTEREEYGRQCARNALRGRMNRLVAVHHIAVALASTVPEPTVEFVTPADGDRFTAELANWRKVGDALKRAMLNAKNANAGQGSSYTSATWTYRTPWGTRTGQKFGGLVVATAPGHGAWISDGHVAIPITPEQRDAMRDREVLVTNVVDGRSVCVPQHDEVPLTIARLPTAASWFASRVSIGHPAHLTGETTRRGKYGGPFAAGMNPPYLGLLLTEGKLLTGMHALSPIHSGGVTAMPVRLD